MKKLNFLILFVVLGLAVQLSSGNLAKAAENDVVVFEDANLEKEVRSQLGAEELTKDRLLGLNELYVDEEVSNLTGLEEAKNLKVITLNVSRVTDFSPISGLEQLEEFAILNNEVSKSNVAESIKNLTNLMYLMIPNHSISDLSVFSNLMNLQVLILANNQISDLTGITKLPNLIALEVSGNKITDVAPILKMPNLQALGLEGNPINLSKTSAAYQHVQTLLKNDVMVYLGFDTVFKLYTKKVTDDSITIEWDTLENTKQITSNITLYLNGHEIAVMDDLNIKEYTFDHLEKGKDYEIIAEFDFEGTYSNELKQVKLSVKAEEVILNEKVVTKPTVVGKNATITYQDINAVAPNGELILDLQDYSDEQVNVHLDNGQIKVLQDHNISIAILKNDVTVMIPASNLGNGQDVDVIVKRLTKADGALSATYDFTIQTAIGNISNFVEPVTLSFNVDKEAVKNANNVKISYYNETAEEWEEIGGNYVDGVVTAETNHFSSYTVFEKQNDPQAPENDDKVDPVETDEDQKEETDDLTGNKNQVDKDDQKKTEDNKETTDKNTEKIEGGKKLPDTATNTMNLIMLGASMILLAIGLIVYQKRKERA